MIRKLIGILVEDIFKVCLTIQRRNSINLKMKKESSCPEPTNCKRYIFLTTFYGKNDLQI